MSDITIRVNSEHDSSSISSIAPEKKPLKILVLGNFSGRRMTTLGQADHVAPSQVSAYKIFRVDKDNFDEIFSRLTARVHFSQIDESLDVDELEHFEPAYLYRQLNVFASYRQILSDLRSTDRCEEAIGKLQAQGVHPTDNVSRKVSKKVSNKALNKDEGPERGDSALLASMLKGAEQESTRSTQFSVEALIKDTVAPYVEQKANPNVNEYIDAVESAVADLLQRLLQDTSFSDLERLWRSLDLLNRRLDTDRACQLHIMDVSRDDLNSTASLPQEQLTGSAIYQRIVAENQVVGGQAFDLIVIADEICGSDQDFNILKCLSILASRLGSRLLCGLSPTFLDAEGVQNINEISSSALAQHKSLRELQTCLAGCHSFVSTPGYLVRLPYGADAIEGLQFEEKQHQGVQQYLWGNSAFLLALAIAQEYQNTQGSELVLASCEIDHLPLHVTTDKFGEQVVVPPSGCYVYQSTVEALQKVGLTVLQSVKNTDRVLIGNWVEFSAA